MYVQNQALYVQNQALFDVDFRGIYKYAVLILFLYYIQYMTHNRIDVNVR